MSAHVGDGTLVFVVDDNNLISVLGKFSDVNSHAHDGWVVEWGTNLRDRGLKHVWEWSSEAGGSLFTDGEDGGLGSVEVWGHLLDVSDDGGVNGTTESLIGGNWDNDSNWIRTFLTLLSLHELITFENHINCVAAELSTSLESTKILLHLGGGHHLHSLGNLLNRVNGLHSNSECLLRDGKISMLDSGEVHHSWLGASLEDGF